MLETPHVLVGVAIATKIPDPIIALPLAFASHFVLDVIPHWNPHLNTELIRYGHVTRKSTVIVAVDVAISLALGLLVALNFSQNSSHMLTIALGGLAGVLPDVIEGPYFFLKWRSKLIQRWLAFQKSIQTDTTVVPGLSTQLATIVAAFWWIAG